MNSLLLFYTLFSTQHQYSLLQLKSDDFTFPLHSSPWSTAPCTLGFHHLLVRTRLQWSDLFLNASSSSTSWALVLTLHYAWSTSPNLIILDPSCCSNISSKAFSASLMTPSSSSPHLEESSLPGTLCDLMPL